MCFCKNLYIFKRNPLSGKSGNRIFTKWIGLSDFNLTILWGYIDTCVYEIDTTFMHSEINQ